MAHENAQETGDAYSTRNLDLVIALVTFLIVLGKALPWIAISLATWSLVLGILSFVAKDWGWGVVEFALALGGFSFVWGLFRRHATYRRINARHIRQVEFAQYKEAETA